MDTVACRAFQGPGGQARSLSALTQQLLGRSIRTSGAHSARCQDGPCSSRSPNPHTSSHRNW